uniref:Uncharacterized protein n=1 Tax=Oryza glumipatula TaxID=40148 RepID=A0A0E0ABC4_9ORYZ
MARALHLAVTAGIEPTKLFCWRQMAISDEVFNRDFGSCPLRLLLISLSTWRDELFAKDSGMLPVRALLPRSTYLRETLLPRNGGMSPVSLFLARTSVFSLGRFPKVEGMRCKGGKIGDARCEVYCNDTVRTSHTAGDSIPAAEIQRCVAP